MLVVALPGLSKSKERFKLAGYFVQRRYSRLMLKKLLDEGTATDD